MIVNTLDKKYVMVYTSNNSNYPNQLLSVCEYNPVSCACTVTNSVSYDSSGRPVLYRGNSLSWDIRRLTGYGSNTFTYDSEGNRIGKNSTKYVYEDGKLRLEDRQDQNSNYKFNYIYGVDGIIGFYTDDLSRNENNEAIEEYYFYQKNQQGDVVELIRYSPAREDVQLEATYVYDAWGNHKVLNPDGSENTNPSFIGNINPIRYRSYYYDVETGLYYLHSRYYDPRVCRFISPDDTDYLDPSMISGMNLYAYCGNNPVNRSDLTGTFWDTFVNEISVFWENTKRFFNALGDAVSIDFENDVITINHTLTEVNFKGQTKLNPADRTKNKSSCRTLPLSGSVKIRFIALRAQQEENKKLCGNSYNKEWSDYVFVNEIGDIITPSYMESAFPKLLKKCGLEHRRFHDLRHTCATLMNQQKVPLNHLHASELG